MKDLRIRVHEEDFAGAKFIDMMKERDWSGQKVAMFIFKEYFSSQEEVKKEVSTRKPKSPAKRFVKPEWAELAQYFLDQGSHTCQDDATAFVDYYDSIGWKVGKAEKPMKDWKASVRNWMRGKKQHDKQSGSKAVSGRDAITFKHKDF